MILVDTGPLVALFDPADGWHAKCVKTLRDIREPLCTTTEVLTEAFHLLALGSIGSHRLMDFINDGGLAVWYFNDAHLQRAFELMVRYQDVPMDMADASLVVAAETTRTRKVFSIDRKDFAVYRARHGHRNLAFEVLS